VARLPRPKLPSAGRIRARVRARRGAEARADAVEPPAETVEARAETVEAASPPQAPAPEPEPEAPPAPSRRRWRDRLPRRSGEGAPSFVRRPLGAVGGVLGRIVGAIGGALAGVGGWFAGAGGTLRNLWYRLSLSARQRIAAALGVGILAAAIWFAALPNLPCEFPAGDACPPSDDAVEIVPGDALAYVHANIDPDTEQYEAAAEIGARVPALSQQLLRFVPSPSGVPVDFPERVRPWLGGEVAMAIVPGEGGRPEEMLMFEADDATGAQTFAEETASGPLSEADYEGVAVSTDQRGRASAVSGGFLLIGDETAVERTIDVERGEGRSLADSPLASDVLEDLPDDSVAQAAVSEDGVAELLSGGRSAFDSLEAFVNFEATVGAGAALVATDDALELALHSELDPERLESSPGFFDAFPSFEPSLSEELGRGTLAYVGLGDPGASIAELFTQALAEAPGIATGFDELVEDVRRSGDVDLEGELLPLLAGEAAVAIEPGGAGAGGQTPQPEFEAEVPGEGVAPDVPGTVPPEELVPEEGSRAPGVVPPASVPYVLFVAEDVDEERARETLAKLQGPLANALDPTRTLQAPVFSEREIDGVEAHSLRLSRTVDLTYAVFDGKLVVASDPRGVSEVRRGEGGLPETDAYERAADGLPDEPAFLAYLNLADLIALAERAGLSQDPAYATFAADIRRLQGFGLAVERGETSLDTTIRLTVGE
jgi:hypothetical protein